MQRVPPQDTAATRTSSRDGGDGIPPDDPTGPTQGNHLVWHHQHTDGILHEYVLVRHDPLPHGARHGAHQGPRWDVPGVGHWGQPALKDSQACPALAVHHRDGLVFAGLSSGTTVQMVFRGHPCFWLWRGAFEHAAIMALFHMFEEQCLIGSVMLLPSSFAVETV